eukprot:TRINITY_DN3403_c0_g1_i2.p1 TRINITY_DN3403_c0_g1~~TRINITY_DN3403_c0_g1_i2.p1  ORF type:complete len:152 (+),score=11.57 TRINITY_DN3403_c0_g1_i2:44-499(+)
MNSELSKFIEEGLKNGQVHQPKQTNRLLLSSSNSSSSNSHNSSQHNKEQQLQKQQDQQVPEISAGTVWKGLFAFLIALIILLYMFTSSSVQKQDQIDLEFRLGNARSIQSCFQMLLHQVMLLLAEMTLQLLLQLLRQPWECERKNLQQTHL